MTKTNYPSITPLTPTAGQSEITFRFNVTSFNEISELYWEVCNEEDPTSTIASGYLENDHDFWPYGVNFEIEITELEYNSGSYICRLSATNSNGTTESTQKCTLEKYIDWAEPESVLAGNRFIANGSEEIGSLPAIDSSEISVDGDEVIIPVGVVTQSVTVKVEHPDFMTLTAHEANSTVKITKYSSKPLALIYYSTDKTNWSAMVNNQTITLTNAGDKLYVYGDNPNGLNYTKLTLSGAISCSGNILALIDKSGTVETLPDSAFADLFNGSTGLIGAPDLYNIPLSASCYASMFKGCTALTTAPALPATTLAQNCYSSMFDGCTALASAPTLSATTLAQGCYSSMFNGCTSLTQAPALPATTLAQGCYSRMFYGCTSLTQAPALPATTLTGNCYSMMFNGCTSLTQAPALPATTLALGCYSMMFNGCTSLTQAPALPATTLTGNCYYMMFNGCTSLTQAPALPATRMAEYCYTRMFYGCTSLTQAPALPATALADSCYASMFSGCTSLTQAPALPATALADSCYASMFDGCTALAAAPELPATTTVYGCYNYMFRNCSNINRIVTYATSWNVDTVAVSTNWLKGTSVTGDFYNLGGATIDSGVNGIPSGWTEHHSL